MWGERSESPRQTAVEVELKGELFSLQRNGTPL
jgi:hypothetical protein